MKKLTLFLLAPLREGRPAFVWRFFSVAYFYSRPCVRGDFFFCKVLGLPQRYFYSRPCVRGDFQGQHFGAAETDFYSRPCVRGDDC